MMGEAATGEGTLVFFSDLPQHVHDHDCTPFANATTLPSHEDHKHAADRDTLIAVGALGRVFISPFNLALRLSPLLFS